MAWLNVVAVVYPWALRRSARSWKGKPRELESLLAGRRKNRWRRAVFDILASQVLEIGLVVVVPGIAAALAADAIPAGHPVTVTALNIIGATLASFPLAMFLVVLLWSLVPERRTSGFLDAPDRLWLPSLATLAATVVGSVLTFNTLA